MTPELWVAVISGAFAFAGAVATLLGKRRADADANRLRLLDEVQEERQHVIADRDAEREANDELRRRLREALDQIETLQTSQREQARALADIRAENTRLTAQLNEGLR